MKRPIPSLLARFSTLACLVCGCASAPPEHPGNVCEIFREKPGWYRAVQQTERRWEVPVHVIMAVTYRESSYVHDARPEREKLLWVIPWKRPSSAYGYAQATDEAWSDYRHATGHRWADRDDFGDAIDFVGWYLDRSHRELGIARNDARLLYLSYHEGPSGYRSGRWKRNAWLKRAADKVATDATRYEAQLASCRSSLKRRRFLILG